MGIVIEKSVRDQIEPMLEDTADSGRIDLRFTIRQASKNGINKNKGIDICFIDLKNAFVRIGRCSREGEWRKHNKSNKDMYEHKDNTITWNL